MSVLPFGKPTKRIRDPEVFRRLHENPHDCLSCGRSRQLVLHHLLHRSQGGDDVEANLVFLCDHCHAAYHGTPTRAYGKVIDAAHVRRCLGRYLRSEAGEDACAYLIGKLQPFGAEAFVQRLEA